MKKWLLRIGLGLLVTALVMAAYAYYQMRSRGFWRIPVYETVAPDVPQLTRPAVLVFSKTNSFIHQEAIPAAEAMFEAMTKDNGWSIYITQNGAVHNPEDLAKFDTIVWNNVTGDVLTEPQQQALIAYLEAGGGWVGIHGAGDSSSEWDWYKENLIGAEFIGHPMDPQFQSARVQIEQPTDPIVAHLGSEWTRTDEWYSFAESPRKKGIQILTTLDESSYSPMFYKKDIRMGEDHPIVWKHCLAKGRAFYSTMGHTAESYSEPKHREMLERAVAWTAGLEGAHCAGMSSSDQASLVNCPLRDEPYTVDTPLMDILLKPEARDAISRETPGLLDGLPSQLLSTEPPAMSAIMTVRNLAAMRGTSVEAVAALDQELRALGITATDRKARCARYDVAAPEITVPEGSPRLLLFEKMTGFRDGPSVEAAADALQAMAERNGWSLVRIGDGGAMTPEILRQFDAVIWNNVSGDVLTLAQRHAFEDYVNGGGGFVGIHGSGGDPQYYWDWYVDELIGARFSGHTHEPHFQDARIVIEGSASGIGQALAPGWTLNDEWYSFKNSPRDNGADVIATLDESTYKVEGMFGQDLRMGDHPIVWSRCVENGPSFYSAIGHRPEVYADASHLMLLEQGILWAAGRGKTRCEDGRQVPSAAQ